MPWEPGQSGNPGGRKRTKPISDSLRTELEQPVRGKSGKTKRQALVDRLLLIALTGKRTEALAAMKLIFSYTDGLPTQQVEVDVYDVARELAQARGLDPERVINLYEQIKRRRAS
jgi:hypothetical protein